MMVSRMQREGHISLLLKCINNQCQCRSLSVAPQCGPAKYPSCGEQKVGSDFLARWSVWFPNAVEGRHSWATVGAFFFGLSSALSSFKPGRWQSGRRIWKMGLKLKPGIWNSFGRLKIILQSCSAPQGTLSFSTWWKYYLGTGVILGASLCWALPHWVANSSSWLSWLSLHILSCLLAWATECKYIWTLLILLWLYWNDLPYFKIIKAEAT